MGSLTSATGFRKREKLDIVVFDRTKAAGGQRGTTCCTYADVPHVFLSPLVTSGRSLLREVAHRIQVVPFVKFHVHFCRQKTFLSRLDSRHVDGSCPGIRAVGVHLCFSHF